MDPENLAQVQEEVILTRLRNLLNQRKVKLWEPPYYDPDKKVVQEASLHELAVSFLEEVPELVLPHVFQGLQMLQSHALEKLVARDRYRESGVASLKLRCAKGLKSKVTKCDIRLDSSGADLYEQVAGLVGVAKDQLKIISSGRVVQATESLGSQGVKNSGSLMVVKVGISKDMQVVEEQRRMLEETKQDAARLGSRDSIKDEHYLQVADQSGKSLDLPPEERRALIIAMSLHEKGRAALKKKDYPLALVLLLEADKEFSACSSDLLGMVDNYAILNLDISWCYLVLQTVSELTDAEARLDQCEEKFKKSYGADMERVDRIKGSTGNEQALMMRLHLMQGIVAFHLGRLKEARLLLQKAGLEMQMLAVSETELIEIVGMGYSIAEARLGLRASKGDTEKAVELILRRREEKEKIRREEKEERTRQKLRERLGRCANGSWVNVGYFKTLKDMGFTEAVAAAALSQADNSLNKAVQLLQEEPDLVAIAAEERMRREREEDLAEPSDEMVASVVELGYEPDMARVALRNEGSVEGAVDKLMAGGGVVTDKAGGRGGKRRKTEKEEEDQSAYERIKEGVAEFEEDHLDLDLVEEGEFLEKYMALVSK